MATEDLECLVEDSKTKQKEVALGKIKGIYRDRLLQFNLRQEDLCSKIIYLLSFASTSVFLPVESLEQGRLVRCRPWGQSRT